MPKICVVGAGRWGKNHIRTLKELKCLGGVVDTNPKTLKQISAPTFSTIEEALEQDFDGFIVASSANTHVTLANEILTNKKPILVEKPVVFYTTEAVYLDVLAKKNNVGFMAGHIFLFHDAIRKIKKYVEQEALGEIYYITSNRFNYGTIRTFENVIYASMPHDVSILDYIFEREPESAKTIKKTFLKQGVCDFASTVLDYGDFTAKIDVSWLHPFKENCFVVVGSEGSIWFDGLELSFRQKKEPEYSIPFNTCLPLTEEIKYFTENLNSIKIADGDHIVRVTRALEMIDDSSF